MKYILIIACLVFLVSSRNHHKDSSDAYMQCITENCQAEAIACKNGHNCVEIWQYCIEVSHQSMKEIGECLDTFISDEALDYYDCLNDHCPVNERKSLKNLFKKMN